MSETVVTIVAIHDDYYFHNSDAELLTITVDEYEALANGELHLGEVTPLMRVGCENIAAIMEMR